MEDYYPKNKFQFVGKEPKHGDMYYVLKHKWNFIYPFRHKWWIEYKFDEVFNIWRKLN